MSGRDHLLLEPADFDAKPLPLQRLDLPPPGAVHLWYLDLRDLGSPLQQAGNSLRPEMSPRQERTVRRFYLRLLLGAYLRVPGKEVSVSRLVKGKPVLNAKAHQQALDFSIAGSAGSCLIGVCTAGLIGVDLEVAERRVGNPRALAKRYFNDHEAQAIAALDGDDADRAFIHTWACKEAVVKAAGHGIANQLCRFSVTTDPDDPPRVLQMRDDEPASWRLAMVQPSTQHLGAVALRHGSLAMHGFRLTLGHRAGSAPRFNRS